jgi:hypothetical protein
LAKGSPASHLRLVFWLVLLAVFILATMPHPPRLPSELSDKLQHIAAFLCLTLLAAAAYPRLPPVKLALGMAAFGALIEAVQAIPALNRDAELLDWAADAGATVSMLIAVFAWRRLRRKT